MTADESETAVGPTTGCIDESAPVCEETATVDFDEVESEDLGSVADGEEVAVTPTNPRRINWGRALVYGVIPALALLAAVLAGYFKWQQGTADTDDRARMESLQAAKDSTVALLTYQPDNVEQKLGAARDLLTGEFRTSYIQLTQDVVIPGAKQKQISATATVPAASPVSANENHAVALVFVDQTTVIGNGAPSASTSAVRVTMDKVNGRWLVSQFDPV